MRLEDLIADDTNVIFHSPISIEYFAAMAPRPEIQAWLDKYPAPESKDLQYIDKQQVLERINGSDNRYLILDLRDADYRAGKIKGAIHVPSQSIYHSVQDLYDLAEQSGKDTIYLHCVSSRDRATRTWGWFKDIANKQGNKVEPVIIKGGFTEWARGGDEFIKVIDEFKPEDV